MNAERGASRMLLFIVLLAAIGAGYAVYRYELYDLGVLRGLVGRVDYLRQGEKRLAEADEAYRAPVAEDGLEDYCAGRLKEAVGDLELARKCTSNPSRARKIAYLLGCAHLRLREYEKAGGYFAAARDMGSDGGGAPVDGRTLDRLVQESAFRVDGIMHDSGMAVVNGNVVRKGDWIRGAQIEDITNDYVMFSCGGRRFSDSVDRFSALARKRRESVKAYFQNGRTARNAGIKAIYFASASTAAGEAMVNFRMDADQAAEMKSIMVECGREIGKIEKELVAAKRRKAVVAGMSPEDVIEVMGRPLGTQQMIGMDEDELWKYRGCTIYFKNIENQKVVDRIK